MPSSKFRSGVLQAQLAAFQPLHGGLSAARAPTQNSRSLHCQSYDGFTNRPAFRPTQPMSIGRICLLTAGRFRLCEFCRFDLLFRDSRARGRHPRIIGGLHGRRRPACAVWESVSLPSSLGEPKSRSANGVSRFPRTARTSDRSPDRVEARAREHRIVAGGRRHYFQ